MSKNAKNRVCCLYRVSTDKQVDYDSNHEADIPMQRKACHRFAERMNWVIVHEEQEDGVSGHKIRAEKRDKIQTLKTLALQGKFDILLVFMFDRIGRIADETPFVVEWFFNHGIQVWSTIEGEQRFDNHIDKLLNYIRFWQADGESEKTSIRTRTSLGQIVEDGHYKGGVAAFGYDLVKNGRVNKRKHELYDLQINEAEAETVRLIFNKYLNEGYGVQRLADYLNEHGYPKKEAGKWSRNSIRNIIRNETYTGVLRCGESRSALIPELQIISVEQYQEAQNIREQRADKKKNEPRVPINMKGNSLLSGNVFCGHCGARLNLSTAKRYRRHADGTMDNTRRIRYICYGKSRKLTDCDGQTTYIRSKLDDIVDAVLKQIFVQMRGIPKEQLIENRFRNDLIQKKTHLADLRKEATKANEKLNVLRAEVANALQGNSDFSPKMLAELIREGEAKLEENRRLCEEAEAELEKTDSFRQEMNSRYEKLISWAELYENADIEAKKLVANAMITRIDVYRGYHLQIALNMDIRQFFMGLELPAKLYLTA